MIVLNSNCGFTSCGAEEKWLKADLAASGAACTIAYWHHPQWAVPTVQAWIKDLYVAGGDIILNGETHNYQRFYPQNGAGALDTVHGVTQFIVGTGGAKLFGTLKRPNLRATATVQYGILKLELYPGSYTYEFITTTGSKADSGSGACHRTNTTTTSTTTSTQTTSTVSLTQAIGGSVSHSSSYSGSARAYAFTATNTGTVTSVGINVYAASGKIETALYDDSGGHPNNLLGYSGSVAAVKGWNDPTLNVGVYVVAGSTYYMSFQASSSSCALYYSGSGARYGHSQSYGSFPNPYGGNPTSGNAVNLRITYSEIEGYTGGTTSVVDSYITGTALKTLEDATYSSRYFICTRAQAYQ